MARRWPVETAQDVHQRGFTGTARTHERDEFAAFDFKRHAAHSGHFHFARVINLVYVNQPNERAVFHADVFFVPHRYLVSLGVVGKLPTTAGWQPALPRI